MFGKKKSFLKKTKKQFKNSIYAKILYGFCGIAVFVGIFFLLMLTANSEKIGTCKDAGFDGADFFQEECSVNSNYAYDRIAIVLGNTANTPAPELNDTMKKYILNSLASSVKNDKTLQVEVFSAESSSSKIGSIELGVDANKDDWMLVDDYVDYFQTEVNNQELNDVFKEEPTTDGAKYLETIQRAYRSIDYDDEKGVILVTGSGLSDGGVLNFAENDLLSYDSDEIISQLEQEGYFDDQDNKNSIDLAWFGIGETALPQQSISDDNKENVQNIYEEFLANSYRKMKVKFYPAASFGDSLETEYTVKTTPVEDDGVVIFEGDFSSDSGELQFKGGTAEFANETDAKNKVAELTQEFNNGESDKIYVYGYVAYDGSVGSCNNLTDEQKELYKPLSQQRADAVKNLFVSNGVQNDDVVTEGKGLGDIDLCSSDNEKNRKVVVKITGRK